MDNEAALNRKLAEWAGFIYMPHWKKPWKSPIIYKGKGRVNFAKLPNFPQSLDACFKWLVPKLREKYHISLTTAGDYWEASIEPIPIPTGISGYAADKDPALALCLAIEKLILVSKLTK